jgi:putative nucleotidyltransferase with HDIG domain
VQNSQYNQKLVMTRNKKKYVVKPATRQRCIIQKASPELLGNFVEISFELFHFLYQLESIDFTLYFRVEDELIEFMKPNELSKELLDQLSSAMTKEYDNIALLIRKDEDDRYRATIDGVRQKRISTLIQKDPDLDPKVLNLFADLSSASQMVVRGGLTHEVVGKVSATASKLVDGLMDNEVAIGTLSKMVLADPTLYDHSAAVAMIASVIGSQLLTKKLNSEESALVARCGLYHDVGKTCVPSAILNKPGKFSPEEFEVMKSHTVLGFEELQKARKHGASIEDIVCRVALEHHERFTGKGYPFGRAGRLEENPTGIHLYTRIVTIADVYSALLMKRVYKPAYDAKDALAIMVRAAAEEYDPEIFQAFLKHVIKSLKIQVKTDKDTKDKGPVDKGKIFILEDGKLTLKK